MLYINPNIEYIVLIRLHGGGKEKAKRAAGWGDCRKVTSKKREKMIGKILGWFFTMLASRKLLTVERRERERAEGRIDCWEWL